ncbi:MAG: VWA domain-containing protein [Halobacteriales archaeon]
MIPLLSFSDPQALLLVPVAAAVLYYVFYVSSDAQMTSRRRAALYVSRVLVVSLVLVALAGPYVVGPVSVDVGESVQVLVDESDSMDVVEGTADDVVEGLRGEGLEVERTTVASDEDSSVGDGVLANLERDDDLLLVSDGRVTSGASLSEAAGSARDVNARLHSVSLEPSEREAYVEVRGPSKVGAGSEAQFEVVVDGVSVPSGEVEVSVNGDVVETRSVDSADSFEFSHSFAGRGDNRVTARLESDDRYSVNDDYRKSVRVVERPRLLYVSESNYPYSSLLEEAFEVERASEVPSDLDGYYGVVLQNEPAGSAGDLTELQEYVLDGNGLVVAGGPSAYENGGYSSSPLGGMLPVREGSSDLESDVVFLMDVSGSVTSKVSLQKSLAASALEGVSDDFEVGVLSFDHGVYREIGLTSLEDDRESVENGIAGVQAMGGSTRVDHGIRGAAETLDGSGNVVLFTDGSVEPHHREKTLETAREVGREGVRVFVVGVGDSQEGLLRRVASETGGRYYPGSEADRLSLVFGDQDDEDRGGLSVADSSHFVTRGVEMTGEAGTTHDVVTRGSADLLVVSGDGSPVVSGWRYGSGRVVSITGHRGDGVLGDLLESPDSAVATRAATWAAGDPERLESEVFSVPDVHRDETEEVTYRGDSRPRGTGLDWTQVSDSEYTASLKPDGAGFERLGTAEYAVNYPREYAGFGVSDGLRSAVASTDGSMYEPGDVEAMAEEIRDREEVQRTDRKDRDWLFLLLALALYLTEVSVRRLEEVYGYRLAELVPQPIYRWID